MFDCITTVSIAVQALATIALVWATALLVRHTKTLANVTKDLARIEHSRETKAQREETLIDIQLIYELTEKILKVDPGSIWGRSLPDSRIGT